MTSTNPIPHGYCQCGCGERTNLATQSSTRQGWVKGQPLRFVKGHQNRVIVRRPITERFWEKVDKRSVDECWEWTAARFRAGYGALATTTRGQPVYAHRFSYELHNGPIPEGAHVCHRCDNPPCCNPTHLFLGTHQDNMEDRNAKGRCRGARGERHRSAKLTAEQVLAIRAEYTGERGQISALARRYGVTKMAMGDVIRRRTWAWL